MNGYLYRYSAKKYNDMLLNEGCIRIGTLFDFRRSEHKAGIADPSEGKKVIVHHVDDWKIDDEIPGKPSKTMRAMQKVGNFAFEPGGGQRVSGITFERQIHTRDYYIHCSAHKLSMSVMEQFEGADSCVEIVDPLGFYGHLTESLNKIHPVKFEGVFFIQYREREEEWNGEDYGVAGCFIKEPEFSRQCEVRAIWTPLGEGDIKPEVIRNMHAARHCKRKI